jgi:3-hydroxy-3-methylglutaryl CoA synthase
VLWCGQTSPVVAHLPFADHVHKLDGTQNDSRTTEVLEALYRACDALDRAMVLLDDVVEVFALSDHDLGAMLPIVGLDA